MVEKVYSSDARIQRLLQLRAQEKSMSRMVVRECLHRKKQIKTELRQQIEQDYEAQHEAQCKQVLERVKHIGMAQQKATEVSVDMDNTSTIRIMQKNRNMERSELRFDEAMGRVRQEASIKEQQAQERKNWRELSKKRAQEIREKLARDISKFKAATPAHLIEPLDRNILTMKHKRASIYDIHNHKGEESHTAFVEAERVRIEHEEKTADKLKKEAENLRKVRQRGDESIRKVRLAQVKKETEKALDHLSAMTAKQQLASSLSKSSLRKVIENTNITGKKQEKLERAFDMMFSGEKEIKIQEENDCFDLTERTLTSRLIEETTSQESKSSNDVSDNELSGIEEEELYSSEEEEEDETLVDWTEQDSISESEKEDNLEESIVSQEEQSFEEEEESIDRQQHENDITNESNTSTSSDNSSSEVILNRSAMMQQMLAEEIRKLEQRLDAQRQQHPGLDKGVQISDMSIDMSSSSYSSSPDSSFSSSSPDQIEAPEQQQESFTNSSTNGNSNTSYEDGESEQMQHIQSGESEHQSEYDNNESDMISEYEQYDQQQEHQQQYDNDHDQSNEEENESITESSSSSVSSSSSYIETSQEIHELNKQTQTQTDTNSTVSTPRLDSDKFIDSVDISNTSVDIPASFDDDLEEQWLQHAFEQIVQKDDGPYDFTATLAKTHIDQSVKEESSLSAELLSSFSLNFTSDEEDMVILEDNDDVKVVIPEKKTRKTKKITKGKKKSASSKKKKKNSTLKNRPPFVLDMCQRIDTFALPEEKKTIMKKNLQLSDENLYSFTVTAPIEIPRVPEVAYFRRELVKPKAAIFSDVICGQDSFDVVLEPELKKNDTIDQKHFEELNAFCDELKLQEKRISAASHAYDEVEFLKDLKFSNEKEPQFEEVVVELHVEDQNMIQSEHNVVDEAVQTENFLEKNESYELEVTYQANQQQQVYETKENIIQEEEEQQQQQDHHQQKDNQQQEEDKQEDEEEKVKTSIINMTSKNDSKHVAFTISFDSEEEPKEESLAYRLASTNPSLLAKLEARRIKRQEQQEAKKLNQSAEIKAYRDSLSARAKMPMRNPGKKRIEKKKKKATRSEMTEQEIRRNTNKRYSKLPEVQKEKQKQAQLAERRALLQKAKEYDAQVRRQRLRL